MKKAANVKSLDALRAFRMELKRYLEATIGALESLKVESNKAMNWIEQDRVRYWPNAAKRASDELVEARNALLRCKMAAMEGQSKSCVDEKKAVERLKARQRHCEKQVKVTRSWRHKMRHATEEFDGKAARLSHYVENDLPKAIAAMDRMIASLEKYAEKAPPTAGPIATSSGHSSNSSQPVEESDLDSGDAVPNESPD